MEYFKKIKAGAIIAVESNSFGVPTEGYVQATEQEYKDFFNHIPNPEPIVEPTLEERIRVVVLKMKDEGLIK